MSHTPGPWGYGHEIHLVGNSGIYEGQDMREEVYDATVFAGEGDDWEQLAIGVTSEDNARLIASAPELLEALEELTIVINESEGVVGWHLNGEVARWDEFDCVQKIMAVIKKARGEE